MSTREELEAQAAALREKIAAPAEAHEALQEIEAKLAEQEAAAEREAAQHRLRGVQGAVAELDNHFRADVEAVEAAVAVAAKAIEQLNARFAKIVDLTDEAHVLCADHGFPRPKLPAPIVPGQLRLNTVLPRLTPQRPRRSRQTKAEQEAKAAARRADVARHERMQAELNEGFRRSGLAAEVEARRKLPVGHGL